MCTKYSEESRFKSEGIVIRVLGNEVGNCDGFHIVFAWNDTATTMLAVKTYPNIQ
jgi:hypothetical protein